MCSLFPLKKDARERPDTGKNANGRSRRLAKASISGGFPSKGWCFVRVRVIFRREQVKCAWWCPVNP